MLKQTIKFKDYNNNDREVVEYFHLNEAEIVKMQAESTNGIQADMQDIVMSNDVARLYGFIEMLVHRSYGKKSEDGLHFRKSPEILADFVNSAYYSDFILGLLQDDGRKGQEFITGIMPAKLVQRAMAQAQGQPTEEPDRQVYAPSARETFAAAQAANQQPQPSGFDQPSYPRVAENPQPAQTQQAGPSAEELARFRAWQESQQAAAQNQNVDPMATAPASPDVFRVPEEPQPMQGLPRPPHEQTGPAQQ